MNLKQPLQSLRYEYYSNTQLFYFGIDSQSIPAVLSTGPSENNYMVNVTAVIY